VGDRARAEAAAAAALPGQWRELVRRGDKEHLVLKVPRLRSNAFCGVRLHPGAAHECRFVLQPSKGMVACTLSRSGNSTTDCRSAGVTWALRPKR